MGRSRLAGAAILALAAAGVVVGLQLRAAGAGIQRDLDTARSLLARAGGPRAGSASQRQTLVRRAESRLLDADGRLHRWPLRPLAAVPLLGRDVRTAAAITGAALGTARAAERVTTALLSVERRPGARSVSATAAALLDLGRELGHGTAGVRRARPLLAGGARRRFLAEARSAQDTAERAGRGLGVVATLYGPPGSARYFLAFQNPGELRGTGGLIGQYGILESSPTAPVVRGVWPQRVLGRPRSAVPPPAGLARRYRRLGVTSDWRSVNIPPDLPTVGSIIVAMYQRSTGQRLDGVIMMDPFALAGIVRVAGPIKVDGLRLGPSRLVRTTLLDAYIRYPTDNWQRRRFLDRIGLRGAEAARRALADRPVALLQALAEAARGRHLAVYAADPEVERDVLDLGLGASAAAPPVGDYLMPVGVNVGANKLDTFLRRHLRWSVRLQPDGGAHVLASMTLRNSAPSKGLPRYVIGPFSRRFKAGENRTLETLYVADAYGFTRALRNGRMVGVGADQELRGLALSQVFSLPAGRSTTVEYDLVRRAAVQVDGGRMHYRLLLRPQPTVNPDQLEVAVAAPAGWRFVQVPDGFAGGHSAVRWSGLLDQERTLDFLLSPLG
jgi:hypothetical protein